MFLYFSGRMPQLSRFSVISRCGRISVAAMMRSASGYTGFMSEQHYFSSSPEAEFKPRRVQVELAGRQVSVTTANGIFSPSGIDKGTAVLFRAGTVSRTENICSILDAAGDPSHYL